MSEPQTGASEQFLQDAKRYEKRARFNLIDSQVMATASGVMGALGVESFFFGGISTVNGFVGASAAAGLGYLAHKQSKIGRENIVSAEHYRSLADEE